MTPRLEGPSKSQIPGVNGNGITLLHETNKGNGTFSQDHLISFEGKFQVGLALNGVENRTLPWLLCLRQ